MDPSLTRPDRFGGLIAAWILFYALVPAQAHGGHGSMQEQVTRATQSPASADAAEVNNPEEVRFRNGDLTLGGLFFRPEGVGPFPAAVFIQGSGPSSRNNHWPRAIVKEFLGSGVAVLLPDKRGSDASEGDWRTADFEDLAEDALAGVHFVQARADVDGERVGVVGLSQGGRIAPIAASRSDAIAFVVDIVGAATSLKEQIGWEMYYTFREAGVEGAALQEALTLQVLAEGHVEGTVAWEEYDAVRRAALSGSGGDVARGFPSTQDAWQWEFFRRVINSDPGPYWRGVTQPVLVLYGEDDRNAPVVSSVYELIRVWQEIDHADAALRVIPGTGHGLWETGGDAHRPALHAEAASILRDWLAKQTGPPR